MKTILTLTLMSFLGVIANAQNNPAPAQPAQPAAAAPAPSDNKMAMDALKKKHIDAVAELKKKQVDEMRAFKDSLKGKTDKEIKKAVDAKKAEQKAAVKELKKAQDAEIAQFKKDHPKPAKTGAKPAAH